jgi:hypothetical protein
VIKALKISRNKFKSIFKFKYNFRQLKKLLPIFWEAFQIVVSLINEVFLVRNIIKFYMKRKQFISQLMSEYLLLKGFIYFLFLIILGLSGLIIGIFLRMYKNNQEVYTLIMLLFSQIFHNPDLDYVVSKQDKVKHFYKISVKTIEQNAMSTLKLIFKEPNQIPQISFPIVSDPFVWIDIDFIWEESKNYTFELFKFYQNVNEKVKE